MNTGPLLQQGARTIAATRVAPCHFDVYRADEVSTNSTQFAGGDWRWRLCDGEGHVLASAGGYRHETGCRDAVAALMSRAGDATIETVA